jgi:flagellar protein FlaJ
VPLYYFSPRLRAAVWAASLALGTLLIAYPALRGIYVPRPPYFVPTSLEAMNYVLLGILVSLAGPGFVEYMNYRWLKEAERGLASMFGGLASGVRSGLTLSRAMEVASEVVTKPLAREVRRCLLRAQLGVDFEAAVKGLADRLRSVKMSMAGRLLAEASRSGGLVSEVLDSARRLYEAYDDYEGEKASSLKPYGTVVYISVIIFLVVSYVLIHQFLMPLIEVSRAAGAPFAAALRDVGFYKAALYYGGFVEGLMSGLIVGKLTHGSVRYGLRHSSILCALTMIAFNLLI